MSEQSPANALIEELARSLSRDLNRRADKLQLGAYFLTPTDFPFSLGNTPSGSGIDHITIPAAEEPEEEADSINHPAHYNAHPSGVECIQIAEHFNFNRGCAIKYIWRAGTKDPAREIEDLQKAVWYLQREIDRLSRQSATD